jgi:hypothetical protein
VTHPLERDWMIVAPWWRWTDPASLPAGAIVDPDAMKGRLTAPIFQKYDSASLVNDFIKEPQRCLAFVTDDLLHTLQRSSDQLTNAFGKLLKLGTGTTDGGATADAYLPDPSNTRKIFLDTHKRHYLVVCEVRCDGPGFPKAARDKICKAGFVIRRRTSTAPSDSLPEVKPILKQLTAKRSELARVNQLAEIESAAMNGKTSAKFESLLKTRQSLQARVALERTRFEDWATRYHVGPMLQGWFPSPGGFSKVGSWAQVEDTPSDLGAESSFPLYPLIPDKTITPPHDGTFGTIYFGVLPTSSHDCDGSGRPRFDDQQLYEVRVWVQRHKIPHDPDVPCPCPDGTFWSTPTEPYKLASHFDLTGTSNLPVTIQLPDLNELAAQAKPTLGVGLAKPKGSLMIKVSDAGVMDPTSAMQSKLPEICFFPIPLITIVATFVFQLFLPIVVIVFQLWWMLALKFCILPEVSLSAGITAEIGLSGAIDIGAGVDISAVEGAIALDVDASLNATFGSTSLLDTYSPIAWANALIAGNAAAGGADRDDTLKTFNDGAALTTAEKNAVDAAIAVNAPTVTSNLSYEPEVTHV